MSKRTWNKGFPPHTGWWNASVIRSDLIWRWFDAETQQWGQACSEESSKKHLRLAARTPVSQEDNDQMEWTDYWPENSRVPRIDPMKENI